MQPLFTIPISTCVILYPTLYIISSYDTSLLWILFLVSLSFVNLVYFGMCMRPWYCILCNQVYHTWLFGLGVLYYYQQLRSVASWKLWEFNDCCWNSLSSLLFQHREVIKRRLRKEIFTVLFSYYLSIQNFLSVMAKVRFLNFKKPSALTGYSFLKLL